MSLEYLGDITHFVVSWILVFCLLIMLRIGIAEIWWWYWDLMMRSQNGVTEGWKTVFNIFKKSLRYCEFCHLLNVFGLDTGKCAELQKQMKLICQGVSLCRFGWENTSVCHLATDQPKFENNSWPGIMRPISKLQTHGGKQTIENVQMIQLAAKLWKNENGFEEYGEKALKVYILVNTVCLRSNTYLSLKKVFGQKIVCVFKIDIHANSTFNQW